MNLKRMATLAVVGAALAAWLAAAATSGIHEPIEPIVPRVSPIDSRGDALASEIARLHDHLRPTASPRLPGRNLFSFTPRPAPVLPPPPPARSTTALTEAPPRPVVPSMKLSGIAEDDVNGEIVRT